MVKISFERRDRYASTSKVYSKLIDKKMMVHISRLPTRVG